MKISERLKESRERKKNQSSVWTQDYVAKRIGVARSTYTAYERGTKTPPPDIISKLSTLLNVSSDYLLGLVDDPQAIDPSVQESFNDPQTTLLFDNWKGMTEEQKAEVLEILKYVKYKNKEKEGE